MFLTTTKIFNYPNYPMWQQLVSADSNTVKKLNMTFLI